MLASMRHDYERDLEDPESKESSIQDPGFIAGPVLGSHFLEEDIEMQEFASCSFGQLSKLPVGVPQSNIQKIQRRLVLNRDRAVQTSEAAKL